jgi:fatty-acyl-CoA synthase
MLSAGLSAGLSASHGSSEVMPDWLAYYAERRPNDVVFVDAGSLQSLTYKEVWEQASRLAAYFCKALGGQKGARIGLLAQNSIQAQVLHQACRYAGMIFLPFNWRLTAYELAFAVTDSDPLVLFVDPQFADLAEAALSGTNKGPALLSLGGENDDYARVIREIDPIEAPVPIEMDDPWCIFYTSGTTGTPKGALLTYRMIFWVAIHAAVLYGASRQSAALVVAPTFHIGGFILPAHWVLMWGGKLYVQGTFNADRCLALLSDLAVNITHFIAAPAHLEMMRQLPGFGPARFDHVRCFMAGGSTVPVELMDLYDAHGAKVVQAWGMTETASNGFVTPKDMLASKRGSVGLPSLTVEARIVNDELADVPVGTAGELWVRGPGILRSYWRRPDADAKSFVDGWFRTGDIFRVDEDGYYFILDRRTDMYISGGENIYPAEIERALRGCAGILESAVIGVPHPKWGRVGKAFILLDGSVELTADDVRRHCQERLARYKIPVHFEFVKEFPRTPLGKVAKHQLEG